MTAGASYKCRWSHETSRCPEAVHSQSPDLRNLTTGAILRFNLPKTAKIVLEVKMLKNATTCALSTFRSQNGDDVKNILRP